MWKNSKLCSLGHALLIFSVMLIDEGIGREDISDLCLVFKLIKSFLDSEMPILELVFNFGSNLSYFLSLKRTMVGCVLVS